MFTPAPLAALSLPNPAGTLYTVPAGMRAIIDGIHLYNINASAQNATITLDTGGSALTYYTVSVGAAQRIIVVDSTAPIYLDAGYIISGLGSLSGNINCWIYGRLEQKG